MRRLGGSRLQLVHWGMSGDEEAEVREGRDRRERAQGGREEGDSPLPPKAEQGRVEGGSILSAVGMSSLQKCRSRGTYVDFEKMAGT